MRNETSYGVALILSAFGLLATASFHPTGAEVLASPHGAAVNAGVHWLALASAGLSLFGLVGLSIRLGLQDSQVVAALTAFALATVALVCAPIVDGLVAPALARQIVDATDEAVRSEQLRLLRYNGIVASSFTRGYVAAASVAILMWSLAIRRARYARWLPFFGIAISLTGLVSQISGQLRMDIHGLMAVVIGQGAWIVWTGALLIFGSNLPRAEVPQNAHAARE